MEINIAIGRIIANRRKEMGLTQEMLAEKLALSVETICYWENGWDLPAIENIHLLAQHLKMSPDALIGDDSNDYEWEIRDQLFSEEHMFTRLKTIAEISALKETYKALYYMREQHQGQYRKKQKYTDTKIPYIIHPLMMACHAQSMGLMDDELLAVILLHDVCEDCGVAPYDLPFSENVREAVDLLTKKPDNALSKAENNAIYYGALEKNRLAAMTKVLDRCNNISTMVQCFGDRKLAEYINETETYVFPVLTKIKQTWPEYNNAVFLMKYHMLSVLEGLKIMLSEKS